MSIASLHRAIAVTGLLVLLASPAAALEPVEPATPWYATAEKIAAGTFDVLLLRPLGVISTVGGFTCYAITLPFSAINGDIKTPWEMFVMESVDFTFRRPLGDF